MFKHWFKTVLKGLAHQYLMKEDISTQDKIPILDGIKKSLIVGS